MQDRLEGCIFQHTFGPRVTKICTLFMEQQSLRICMPMLWSCPCPQDFYKTLESPNLNTKENQYKGSDLFGRPLDNGMFHKGSSPSSGHRYLPSPTFGVCYQPKKVCSQSSAGNSFFGAASEFKKYDFVIDSRKVIQSDQQLFGNVGKASSISNGTDKISRSFVFHCAGSDASKIAISLPTASANSNTGEISELRQQYSSFEGISRGTQMVDNKPKNVKRERSANETITSFSSDRCIQKRVGGIMSRCQDWGIVVTGGAEASHKLPGTTSNKVWDTVNTSNQAKQFLSHSGRQHDSFIVSSQNGGEQVPWK